MKYQNEAEALRRSFGAARSILRRVQWILGGAVVLGVLSLVVSLEWTILLIVPELLLGGALLAAAWVGTCAGVKLGARRARRAVRELPEAEAVRLLRTLAHGPAPDDRLLAEELMKGLHPEGTEAVAAEAPAGRGTEVSGGASLHSGTATQPPVAPLS